MLKAMAELTPWMNPRECHLIRPLAGSQSASLGATLTWLLHLSVLIHQAFTERPLCARETVTGRVAGCPLGENRLRMIFSVLGPAEYSIRPVWHIHPLESRGRKDRRDTWSCRHWSKVRILQAKVRKRPETCSCLR